MDLSTFDPRTGLFRTAATAELIDQGNDLEESIWDYLTLGTVSAVTSAAVGIANTGVAFGELLGFADEDSYIDEQAAIAGMFGNEAADFYGRHKTGIDVAGLVVGSFVPGLGAVRALRAAQSAGRMWGPVQVATGLRNPDLVLGSKALEAAKESVLRTNVTGLRNQQVRQAYMTGVQQQFMEAAAFDIAVAATMNQNAALNPDDLTYIEAAKNVFWEGLPFMLGGAVVGGGLEAVRIAGAINKNTAQRFEETAHLLVPNIPGLTGMTPGDKLVLIAQAATQHQALESTIDAADTFARTQFNRGKAQIKSMVFDTLKQAEVPDADVLRAMEELFDSAGEGNISQVASIVSSLNKVGRLTKSDLQDLQAFYEKTNAPSGVFTASSPEEFAEQYSTRMAQFKEVLENAGLGSLAPRIMDEQVGIINEALKGGISSQGFANIAEPTAAAGNPLPGVMRLATIRQDGYALFVPQFMSTNPHVIDISYKITKAYHDRVGVKFDWTLKQYTDSVFLHELGHVKTNTTKTLNYLRNSIADGTGKEVLTELIQASIMRRRPRWGMEVDVSVPKNDREMAENFVDYMMSPRFNDPEFEKPGWAKYLGKLEELLADGASYLTNPASREVAAKKFPNLAKFFDLQGSIAKAWDDSKAFYNTRTKQVYSSYLPGISDVSPSAKVTINKKGISLDVPELGRKFTTNPKLFGELTEAALHGKVDYLEYDAQWKMYDKLGKEDFVQQGDVNITEKNLPAMEKLLQLSGEDPDWGATLFEAGKVRYNGEVVSRPQLNEILLKEKQDAQIFLSSMADRSGYNEHHIAKILNIDVDRAIGTSSGDWLLYGKKDFDKPELIKMQYKSKLPEDYQEAAISLSSTMVRQELVNELKQQTAAMLFGKNYKLLETHEIDPRQVGTIAPTESRATLLTALRTRLGSIREKAAYVGKILNQEIVNSIQRTEESFAKHFSVFNRTDKQGLRVELAQIDNLLRRNWYYLARDVEGNPLIIEKQSLHSHLKELAEDADDYNFDPSVLQALPTEIVDALKGTKYHEDPVVVGLSKEVAEFFGDHLTKNAEFVAKKKKLAEARGYDAVLDEHVLYPPPRNLSQSRHFSFVVPQEFTKGSDPRSYMIFAETAAELEAKKGLIAEKYGKAYRVINNEQVKEYKQLIKDYNKGLVFDELHFDSSLMRKGKASELFPNLDLNSSETLNRYFSWTVNQEESLLRSAVELRYDDTIQALRSIDKELGAAERTALDKKWREPDSIWKDTVNIMLDQKSYGGPLENLFVRVNDYIGEAGSRVIDAAFNAFRKPAGKAITQEDLDSFNAELAKHGYEPPTLSAVEAMLTSPDTVKSRTLPNLVRTLSNLTSTFMLRLDYAHSFMQLASTPILALPVIQEAKQALKGTQAGKRLEDMTGVLNPSNGTYEPSAAKLFMEGTQKFWTEEGKAFIQKMKDRNIVSDYMIQYLNNLDFSTFNGSHKLTQISNKIDSLAQFGSKFSGFKFAEDFTRFQVAWAVKRVGELRGMTEDELWSTISSSVDKVHGVYLGTQRTQLFQGVLGQAVGLYQTYFFNFMQNMLKFVSDGNRRQAITMAGMQTSLFGIQSWPGFGQLNQMIGETNSGNLDLYSITGADDPKSTAAYFMYGLASHSLGVPIDFYTRGDLALRHNTVVPTGIADFPVVSTLAKATGNIVNTFRMLTNDDIPKSQAILHGLAHNGMNRPMQGIANILRNKITSNSGQIQFDNSNYVDYDSMEELNWGAMFARALGTRPLNESIILGNYYRDAAYQANYRKQLARLGSAIQYNISSGEVSAQSYSSFAKQYEEIGGDIQNFNAYWARQLRNVQRPVMTEFQKELMQEGEMSRARARIEHTQMATSPWQNDPFEY